MAEIWVTMRSCSECERNHSEDGHGDDCDCWCHDGDMTGGHGLR